MLSPTFELKDLGIHVVRTWWRSTGIKGSVLSVSNWFVAPGVAGHAFSSNTKRRTHWLFKSSSFSKVVL